MFFRGKYEFLSNFYPCRVTVMMGDGCEHTFCCSESAFQASKSADPETIAKFETLDGSKAKSLGRRIEMSYTREQWNVIKDDVMETVVRAKFEQNPDLMENLLAVDGDIIEDNTWHDREWGRYNGVGKNKLGKVLMSVRDANKEEHA